MHRIVTIYLLLSIGVSCTKNDEPIVICTNRCTSASPWKVETLDLGLPCFATQAACSTWATAHGYGDKACVRCD